MLTLWDSIKKIWSNAEKIVLDKMVVYEVLCPKLKLHKNLP